MLHLLLGWECLLLATAALSLALDSLLPSVHLPLAVHHFGYVRVGVFLCFLSVEAVLFLIWLAKVLLAKPYPILQSESLLIGILFFSPFSFGLTSLAAHSPQSDLVFYVLLVMIGLFVFWMASAFIIDILFYWNGPFPYPLVGMIPQMSTNLHRIFDFEADLIKDHACYGKIFSQRILFVMEPSDVEHMLKTNQQNYEQGYLRKRIFEDLLGDGIFNVDGYDWVQQRKSASREFSVSRFRDFMVEVFAEGAGELMEKVDQVAGKSVSCDIQDLYFRLTLKSFAKIAFGLEVDTFSGDRQPPFAVSFDICTRLTNNRFFDMFWELKKFLNIAEERALLRNMKVIDDFVYRIIRDRRAATKSELSERCDMLSQFLTIKDEKGNPPSDKYLRDLIINFLLAGRDTTAAALSWTTFLLAQHPQVVSKLRDEMDKVMAKERNVHRVPNFEELRDMQYLHAIVTESLRLYPPVADDPKVAVKSDRMPSGYYVQEGMWVNYMPYAMGRNEKYYDNPLSFTPERWIDSDGKFIRFSPFRFPVFQAGPRQCLGVDFAYLEAKLMIATLFQQFDVQLAVCPEDVKYEVNLTMSVKNGLPVSVKRA